MTARPVNGAREDLDAFDSPANFGPHWGSVSVNRVTGSQTDRSTHTPAYKEAAVQMRVLGKRDNPLPRENFRYGHPTPQRGVEVERKWNQPGYSLPGNPLVQIETGTRLDLRKKSDPI